MRPRWCAIMHLTGFNNKLNIFIVELFPPAPLKKAMLNFSAFFRNFRAGLFIINSIIICLLDVCSFCSPPLSLYQQVTRMIFPFSRAYKLLWFHSKLPLLESQRAVRSTPLWQGTSIVIKTEFKKWLGPEKLYPQKNAKNVLEQLSIVKDR